MDLDRGDGRFLPTPMSQIGAQFIEMYIVGKYARHCEDPRQRCLGHCHWGCHQDTIGLTPSQHQGVSRCAHQGVL